MSEIAVYNDSVVNQWLVDEVDEKVPAYCVDILKLGMRTEITCQQTRDETKYPSGLYRALCHSPAYNRSIDKSCVLSRFVYALRQLKKNKVSAVVSDEFLKQQGITVSIFHPNEQSSTFQFHQCLVEICMSLNKEQRTDLLIYCAHVCGVSTWRYKSIEALMEMLLQTQINESDQYVLVEGLLSAKASSCINIIERYRKVNGLSEYDLEQIECEVKQVLKETTTSESEGGFSDVRSHSRRHGSSSRLTSVLGRKRHHSGSKNRDDKIDVDETEELLSTSTNCSTPTRDLEVTETIQSGDARESDHISGPAGAAEQANVRKQRRKKVSILSFLSFFTLFCILTVTMLVLVSLSAFQFNPNRTTQYEDTESNTQTTLAIVNPFFTHKVTVTDNEEHLPQYQQHMVSLNMLESDCRELVYESNPSTSTVISQSDSNNVNPTPPYSVKYNSFLKRSRPESDSTMSFLGKVDDCTLPDPCEISINSSLISKRRCIKLSALIQPNPNNTLGYVNITLTFVPTLSAAIGFSVVGVLFILTCPWFVLACYCFFAY